MPSHEHAVTELLFAAGLFVSIFAIGVLYVWTFFSPDRNRGTKLIAWYLSPRWLRGPLPVRQTALVVGIVCIAISGGYAIALIMHMLRLGWH